MGKIEDLLMADERVIKKQGGVQLSIGEPGMPTGDLCLTNKRLIFLVSKGWSVLTPGAGIGSRDLILSLQDVKSVDKGALGNLKIRADREYQFAVSLWHSGGWVDAIKQAIALYPPPTSQQTPIQQPSHATSQAAQPRPTSTARRFCPKCGNPVKPEALFCESCGTRLQ
jgi:hypothetical protein